MTDGALGPSVVVVTDQAAASDAAASHLATALDAAIRDRGRADWATTGGSSPAPIYRILADTPMRDAVTWPSVHVWWGDDRFVPRDHPLSNVRAFDDILVSAGSHQLGEALGGYSGVPLRIEHIHPIRTSEAIGEGHDAPWAAERYAEELRRSEMRVVDGWPVFDLVFLGVGDDGHVLSVFPGSPAFDSTEWALAIPAPTHIEPHVERVTLNPEVIGAADRILVVVCGTSKADAIGAIFAGERDPRRLPAQLGLVPQATWILDEAAAARLPR